MMKFFRRFKDLGITGTQAKLYDKTSREHRLGEIKKEAKEIVKHLKEGDSVLEIAPGPGYLSIELAKLGKYKITGMDISKDFVKIASSNAKDEGVNVDFQEGNVSCMPFPENKFDFIICVLAFKNFKEPLTSLNEMYRVLKPGSTVLIMDLNRNASEQVMKKLVTTMGMKGIKGFIARKIQRSGAYTRNEIETFISHTEFKKYVIMDSLIGFSIYLKK